MFNLFQQIPKKKFIVYDNSLKPYYEAKVSNIKDDKKLEKLIASSRLFLKIEETYYYRALTFD